ncbi:hypothetical protein IAD21_01830 [Abditibacteriota bacterium]|nr:hypothetical protein IAD21_01830 [Abditibacteriota bacterium]
MVGAEKHTWLGAHIGTGAPARARADATLA